MKTLSHIIFIFVFSLLSLEAFAIEKSQLDNFVLPKPESEYDKSLLDDVTNIGWHHVHIQAEGNEPAYAFSLGFYANYKHPEIVVLGLPPKVAQQLLNINAIAIVGAKKPYEPYKAYENIAEGMRIAFIPVARKYYAQYFGYAGWFYESVNTNFPVLQMVWPDKQGHLPWEDGYDKAYQKLQPLLAK